MSQERAHNISFPTFPPNLANAEIDKLGGTIMKKILPLIPFIIGINENIASAAPHLTPEIYYTAKPENYEHQLKYIFKDSLNADVILSSLVTPSSSKEYLVGIRNKNGKNLLFSITPETRVANIKLLKEIESGKSQKYDSKGNKIPFEIDPFYIDLKKSTPLTYKDIKVEIHETVIPQEITDRIFSAWESALLNVKRERKPELFLDGSTYHYSMKIKGFGLISGQRITSDRAPRMTALTGLTDSMYSFSRKEASINEIIFFLDKYETSAEK